MSNFNELFDRISSNSGLIFVDTYEEQRLVREIKRRFKSDSIQFWSATQGMHEIEREKDPDRVKLHHFDPKDARKNPANNQSTVGNVLNALECIEADSRNKIKQESNTRLKHVYVLRDADKFFQNPMPIRKLRDIIYLTSTAGSCMVLSGPGISVPPELEKDCCFVQLPLPTAEEIQKDIMEKRIMALIRLNNQEIDQGNGSADARLDDSFEIDRVVKACMGLTEDEIINTAAFSLTTKKTLDPKLMIEEKKAIINKNDILEYWNCDHGTENVGGFDELKEWFEVQQCVMDNPEEAALAYSEQPKGILILGVQGSGKTHMAKALANNWGKGIIKLEMGRVFAGLVGESEKRMRMALAQAEAAGGVIVIDEIDKGLAGAGSSDRTDGGTTKRVIGGLLTWMQEPHPGLFVIATANDIQNIREAHPELLRKGRFDELFFSDAPTDEEKKEIFAIHLRIRGRDPKKFDLDRLATINFSDKGTQYSYVGAEIEYAIVEAIRQKFARAKLANKIFKIGGKLDITEDDIELQLRKIKPITFVGRKAVKANRDWAKENARNVSSQSVLTKKTKGEKTGGPKSFNIHDDDLI